MPVIHTAVTTEVLDAAAHEAMVTHAAAGASVCFTGMIRDHDPEAAGEVTGIEYSHHPDADAMLAAMVTRLLAEADPRGEARVAVSHRVGHLDVGELALVCAVAVGLVTAWLMDRSSERQLSGERGRAAAHSRTSGRKPR